MRAWAAGARVIHVRLVFAVEFVLPCHYYVQRPDGERLNTEVKMRKDALRRYVLYRMKALELLHFYLLTSP